MARLKYPQDRLAFVYGSPGEPILMPPQFAITLYSDSAGTLLADVVTLLGTPIPNSIIVVGADGLVPEFLGPTDGATSVWARVGNGPLYEMQATLADRMSAVEAIAGSSGPGAHYQHTQSTPATTWDVVHNLGYKPGGIEIRDSAGNYSDADISYVDNNTVHLSFIGAMSGVAYLS